MLTTPDQRAQWAKLADSISGNSHPDPAQVIAGIAAKALNALNPRS